MANTEMRQPTAKMGGDSNGNASPILFTSIKFTDKENNETYQISPNLINIGGESQIYHATSTNGAECVARIDTSGLMYDANKRQNRVQVVKFLKSHTDYKQFHIMPLLATGTVNIEGEDGDALPYPVDIFPYCPNGDLKRLTQNGKKFSYAELKNTVIPALCKALHTIHENNIIHRDIKPENIYELNGEIVVGDFGTAVLTANGDDETVRTELARRTIGYTAHEVTARYVKKASDYFSLGCTLATLYNGKHPYSATLASETEYIFYESMTTKGMLMDYQKGDEPLKNLIDALVRMKWIDRPTHDDIMLWLTDERAFEDKFIIKSARDKITDGQWKKTFNFEDVDYHNENDLAAAMIANWDKAKTYLYRGQVEKFSEWNQTMQNRIDIIVNDSPTDKNHDLGLAYFLHYLQKGGNFCWCGQEFTTLAEIAAYMWKTAVKSNQNKRDEAIKMLRSEYLSWKMNALLQLPNFSEEQKSATKQLLPALQDIEGFTKKYPLIGVYFAIFSWGKDKAILENRENSPDDWFNAWFVENPTIYDNANELANNSHFWGAIASMGFLKAVTATLDKIKGNHGKNLENIYLLFESICKDKTAVRRHYLKYSPKAYLAWLKNHLDLYSFNSSNAKQLKADIEKIPVSASMTLSELATSFNKLYGYFTNFQKLFQGDFLIACLGLTKGKERHGEITATLADAFFMEKFFGEDVPLGFMKEVGLEGVSSENINSEKNNSTNKKPKAKTSVIYYDVILQSVQHGGKIVDISRIVREITGLGLKEAKDLVDNAPFAIVQGITQETAQILKNRLESVGANIRLGENKKLSTKNENNIKQLLSSI
ncbi:MAG: ribosomal protein L7/L12 [Firmicutes bacterium]|nr:ribosomal protein L7/L12 [Bacillota bacterium]